MKATDLEKGLSTADVISILEVSARAGVTKLLFRDLHVEFGGTPENRVEGFYPIVQQHPMPASVGDLTAKDHENLGKEALANEELRMREEQLALALVEDPVRYEELLVDGELGDELDAADDEDDG